MPVILIIFGAIFLDLALRGTEHEFAEQLGEDMHDTHFWAWAVASCIIGAVGYLPSARKASDALLTLIVVSLALSESGLIAGFVNVIKNPPSPSPSVPLPAWSLLGTITESNSGGSTGGGIIGTAASVAGAVAGQ